MTRDKCRTHLFGGIMDLQLYEVASSERIVSMQSLLMHRPFHGDVREGSDCFQDPVMIFRISVVVSESKAASWIHRTQTKVGGPTV